MQANVMNACLPMSAAARGNPAWSQHAAYGGCKCGQFQAEQHRQRQRTVAELKAAQQAEAGRLQHTNTRQASRPAVADCKHRLCLQACLGWAELEKLLGAWMFQQPKL
ncbi:hypothetical protein D9Q98_009887 [Chlorella vulgaris]|uniref:Uncharacterized protein n=1 Tax=Chlorella vulgaris TaxID=3077 RepID=A0A9D4TFQ4_CHLVU|nr:hypothetical protein D9Q98_009887 [Chlorella vulgaris]